MDIRAAIFDVDSTLTAGKGEGVVESSILACKKLKEKGIKVIIASGRPPYAIPVIEGKIFPDYYVGSNGQIISDAHFNTIKAVYLDKKIFDDINQYVDENKLGIFWKFERRCYGYRVTDDMDRLLKALKEIDAGRNPNADELPCGGGLICSREEMLKFKARFGNDIEVVDGGYALYDLGVKGVNKKVGLEILLEQLNISPEQCIAFGDSDNDIEMIRFAGIGVAMGNGFDSVKAVADYTTDTAKNDGIIKALKKFNILDEN